MRYQFPKGFYWGAATSAHQVEGGLVNDWSEWEKENAKRLTKTAEKSWQKWQQDKFPELFEESNYISGKACDQFNRYEEDFDLVKQMGHNAHRFSIDWSRVEPREGEFDQKALEHYVRVVDALNDRGIEPFVTFYHWPIPLWLRDKGGWENEKVVEFFERYCTKLGECFKGKIRYIYTINEPLVFTGFGYVTGEWPPAKKNIFAYLKVLNRLVIAHKHTYESLKKIDPNFQIGIAKNNSWFEPYRDKWVNRVIKKTIDWFNHERFLDAIDDYQDFIGLNHYMHFNMDWWTIKNKDEKVSDMGWELLPESIYHCLLQLKRFNKPIIVSEHGLADRDDIYRKWYLEESLQWIYKAIADGVDVRGYLHWSFMDNFEWSRGFSMRFGLVQVDYKTLARKPRKSAYWYRDVCKNNGF